MGQELSSFDQNIPLSQLNPPKMSKVVINSKVISATFPNTDDDIATDANNTTENINKLVLTVPTQNQFYINDKSLSEYIESEVNSTDNIILKRPVTRKLKKLPPIVIPNGDKQTALNTINSCVTSKNYSIRHMQIGMRIDIPNELEHTATVEALKTAQCKFYTYHSLHTKPKKFVLYGLLDMQLTELRNILQHSGIHPNDVKKLTLKKPRYDGQAVYLLYFNTGSTTLSELRKIKSINHVAIKWDYYHPRKKDSVAQCRNCQQLGHSSINCFMPAKCLVCAENHNTDVCPKRIKKADLLQQQAGAATPIEKSYIKCANCDMNHMANYRGCQKRKEFLKAQAKVSHKRRTQTARRPIYELDDSKMFPALGKANPIHIPLNRTVTQEQPTWADVISGLKKEPDSVQIVIGALQGMIVTMSSMLANLTNLLQALSTNILPNGPNNSK